MIKISQKVIVVIIICTTILVSGGYYTYRSVKAKEKELKSRALSISESIVAAINPERIKTLSATLDDLQNADYIRLKEQLSKVSIYTKSEGIRWIYLMKKNPTNVVFHVISVSPDEFGYAPPGLIYNQPPLDLLSVFENGNPTFSKPYKDDVGEFVSVFIPIRDFATNELLSVAGFDIDQIYWQNEINRASVFPIGLTLIFLIIFLVPYISVSKQLESANAIRESEDRFSAITELALDPIIMMDLGGKVVLWNKAAEKLFGYSFAEVKNKILHQIITPKGKYPIEHSVGLSQFSKTGTSPVFGKVIDLEVVNRQNTIIPISLSITPIKINGKNFAMGIIRDMSEKSEASKELASKNKEVEDSRLAILNILEDVEQEKAQTEALLSGIGDGVIAVGNNGNILYANKASEKILGYPASGIIGKSSLKILSIVGKDGKLISAKDRPISKCLQTGKTVTADISSNYYYLHKDKTKIPVTLTASPVILDGKLFGAIDVFHDVTHDREVDRMKTEFISLASHQLRTPLSAIKWFAEMLLDGDAGKLKKEQIEYVDNIYQSNDRMIELVNSLLNISRIESGRLVISPEPTNLKKLIEDLVGELKEKYQKKNQSLIISVHPKLPLIKLDPSLIRQVYLNLLTNAIKYTPEKGEINVFVSVKGNEIVSQVSDNGYGIPETDKGRVFHRFFRSDNIIKIETEGTGLGLYLAKGIVESSGGKIWFDSKVGKGSTFWFSLPIKGVKPKAGEVTLNS